MTACEQPLLTSPSDPSQRSIEGCPYRIVVDRKSAVCRLVQELVDGCDDDLGRVPHEACQACVTATFAPTRSDPNPVVASLAFAAAESRLAALDPDSEAYRRVSAQREFADANLPRVLPGESDLQNDTPSNRLITRDELEAQIPIPAARQRRRIETLAIGMTTAARRRSTLDASIRGLVACGFDSPHLFIDGDVSLPQEAESLKRTIRSEPAGAYHNFFLGLVELVDGARTTRPGVFAAGGLVNGGASVARCIAEGLAAADDICCELEMHGG